jgi:hypothetical protein
LCWLCRYGAQGTCKPKESALMIHITDTVALDEREIRERFVAQKARAA